MLMHAKSWCWARNGAAEREKVGAVREKQNETPKNAAILHISFC